MRSYTIAKALVLSLRAVSVIARSLPERRSEINSRIAGGHEFSNPLKKLEAADAKVDTAVSEVTTPAATTSIDDLKHRLKGMGLVMISEGMLDEKVYTGTYSIPANNTFSMGSTILEKREKNIQDGDCITSCGTDSAPVPNNDDCATLYGLFNFYTVEFRVEPFQAKPFVFRSCAAWLINKTGDTIVYDFRDFGHQTQWLNAYCIQDNKKSFGACAFGSFAGNFDVVAHIVVAHPSHFG